MPTEVNSKVVSVVLSAIERQPEEKECLANIIRFATNNLPSGGRYLKNLSEKVQRILDSAEVLKYVKKSGKDVYKLLNRNTSMYHDILKAYNNSSAYHMIDSNESSEEQTEANTSRTINMSRRSRTRSPRSRSRAPRSRSRSPRSRSRSPRSRSQSPRGRSRSKASKRSRSRSKGSRNSSKKRRRRLS